MDPEFHRLAIEFCRLIDAPDLLAWLRLPPAARTEDALAALREQRRRLQGMQSNPKYREPALFLIKHYRAIEAVLQDPAAHLREVRERQEAEKLPLLELVIDGILADGVLTGEELSFLREQAASLGISQARLDALVESRARQDGVRMPDVPPAPAGLRTVQPAPTGRIEARGASGKGWWDARLTRALLECVPDAPEVLVDVACGLAWSAHTLLPHLPRARWVGVDEGEPELVLRSVRGAPFADRVTALRGSAAALPLPDGAADVVLSLMTLQRFPDSRPVLGELRRVLRDGGRAVVFEPDGLGQSFWFDGDLTAFNRAFRDVCAEVDARLGRVHGAADPGSRPGIALGPRLGQRLAQAGLQPARVVVHAIQEVAWESFGTTLRRLRAHVGAMVRAAALEDTAPAVVSVHHALGALEGARASTDMGLGGHVLPAFLVVARR